MVVCLRRGGHTVSTAKNATKALALLEKEDFNIILLDLKMPGMSGLEFLEVFKKHTRKEEVVVLTAYADVDSAVQAVRLGAYAYLSKPFDADAVLVQVDNILELQELRLENISLRRQRRRTTGQLVGQNEKMREIYQLIEDIAPTPVTVLIPAPYSWMKDDYRDASFKKAQERYTVAMYTSH